MIVYKNAGRLFYLTLLKGLWRYEGHSLCFAIWLFNNTYNHSVYSSFSKKHTPTPPPRPLACSYLTILSNQLSMTPDHVDWDMSKMTPSKNARALSAFWNCFPFRCTSHRGLSQVHNYGGWVTSWTSLATRKSRVTATVWALALSWWSSRSRTPVQGRRLHHAWKALGKQWVTYQSAVTVFLSSSGMVATWPNFAKKQAIICCCCCFFF